ITSSPAIRPAQSIAKLPEKEVPMPGPLHEIKVVEFTEIIAGPLAGMLLADMGAEVIKIEPPWGEPWRFVQAFSDTESRPFIAYNRGKRSLPLDLTAAEAPDILRRLIPQTDVALVNYRPDVAAKLGVDYETLSALNPRLVYCENTAFGRQGPEAHRPGYDLIIQAMYGLMAAEGKLDNGVPQHIWSSPLVDTAAGFGMAWCICGALFARERTGRGQKVETTLMGMALALLGMRFVQVEGLDRPAQAQTLADLAALRAANTPFPEVLQIYEANYPLSPGNIYYRTYQTQDGAIGVGCLSDPLRRKLLEVLGLQDIRFNAGYDPRSAEAVEFGGKLMQQAEVKFRERTTAHWLTSLEQQGIPAGPVRFVEELFDDPQVQANGLVAELEHREAGKLRMVGPLAQFSETPLHTNPPPALGQHTDEVLQELGFSDAEIRRWRESGVVG
ncbi:MAG: CaiB/BaiF CoA transferase family protein, partial [Dehalococcoidia bacterium]